MRKTILIGGSAGGGVKFITDTILPAVFLKAGYDTTSNLTYGAAQRSGHIVGDVVIGNGGQHFYADVVLALSQEGLEAVRKRINKDTIIVYDSKGIKKESLPEAKKALEFASSDQSLNNVIGLGALLKALGAKENQKEELKGIIKSKIKKATDKNLEMVMEGFSSIKEAAVSMLDLSNPSKAEGYFMSGNEASVWGALMGGANFYAGYPITPSSEAMHEWSRVCNEFDSVMKQANSEEQAIGLVLGAAAKGARAWTATSGPGLSRMLEQIGYGLVSKTPFVIYNVQRGGPSTGMPTQTQQSDLVTAIKGGHGDYPVIVLAPSNVQESFGLMMLAMKLARMYKIGVIVNSSKEVAQRRGKVMFDVGDYDKVSYDLEYEEKRCRTGLVSDGNNSITDPIKAKKWLDEIFARFEKSYDSLCMARFKNIETTEDNTPYKFKSMLHEEFYKQTFSPLSIVKAPKKVYLGYGDTIPILEEMAEMEKDTGMIGLLTLHPFPIKMVKELKKAGTKKLVILEQNRGCDVHKEKGQLASRIEKYFNGKVEVITTYEGRPFFADQLLK